jgi:hypothetical protein
MAMGRLSDHRFLANYFRLYLHAAALNLLVRLRQEIAYPPPAPAGDVPVASLPEPERKRYQNARRRQGPLGEGQPATWRLLLIKVAASVIVSCRRIVVRLERQLAEPALLRAGSSARLSASGRGSLLDRMKPLTTRKTTGGKGAVRLGWLPTAVPAGSLATHGDWMTATGPLMNNPLRRGGVPRGAPRRAGGGGRGGTAWSRPGRPGAAPGQRGTGTGHRRRHRGTGTGAALLGPAAPRRGRPRGAARWDRRRACLTC